MLNVYTCCKVPLGGLVEAGAVVFSEFLLPLLPPLGPRMGGSGQHHTTVREKVGNQRNGAMLLSHPSCWIPLHEELYYKP